MNNIIYDDEIITPEGDKFKYYYDFLKKLDKKGCVKFALFCAKYVNNKSNHCIELVEKWLKDEKSVSKQELWDAYYSASYSACAASSASSAASAAYSAATASNAVSAAYYACNAAYYACNADANIDIVNKYLQILLRKTRQFQNNQVLEQISKTDVDKLELVDWNMITDIMQEEYNIDHGFNYEDIFSRRCLIELLRREYV